MKKRIAAAVSAVAIFSALLGAGPAGAVEPEPIEPTDTKVVEPSDTGSYIVVMEDDPLVAELGADNLGGQQAEQRSAEIAADHDEVLEESGADVADKLQDYSIAVNGFAATLTHDEAVRVAANTKVLVVLPDEMRQITTDSSRDFIGLTGRGEAHRAGVLGEGVIVGVIDTGIWPEHPSFDGTGYPASGVVLDDTAANPSCNFGNTAHNSDDAPFACNNKLIGARQMLGTYRALIGAEDHEFDSARDDNGHGTHTASTAAGNAGVDAVLLGQEYGEIAGIAPRANIIAYKALGELGGFTSDLVSAIDQAVLDGVDVINYSIGGGPGLNGGDAIAFLFAADAGVAVATSAGNSGPGAATLGGPADNPWLTSVGASTQERFFEGKITLGNGAEYTGASITPGLDSGTPLVDAANAGGDLCLPGTLDATAVAGNIVLCRRGAIARAAKGLAVFQAGGAGMILYNNDDVGDLITDTHWVPSVHTDLSPGLEIKAYIAGASNPTAGIETGEDSEWASAPSMASFSSRGPNPSSEDIIKPDVTAPGVQILAGHSPFPDPGSVPGELFQSIAGTSMSSPHVAGAFALLTEVHPDWTPAMMKSALMTTADPFVQDNDRTTRADPFDMGAGHIELGRVRARGSAFNPGLVYDEDLFGYAAFTCGVDAGVFTPGTCDFLAAIGEDFEPSNLNVPSIGVAELAGSQTVTRTVTSVADRTRTFRARIDAPEGYDVEVTPARIRLAPGESATFEVTITNDGSGVIGEWSFGEMRWESGGYRVVSTIAVRGALFDAPAVLNGTGADGSASFDVTFGYSGPYTALGHGLEAATITTDTVVQDPDQNFDPTDGFSNAHPFDLTGVNYFRIAMPPEATEANADLDIYVADPSGAIVAQSTAGGTNELIDIPLPAAGVWTVYIHGWATIGGDSTYDLSTWSVPTTTGGTLTVTDSPASAVLGTTSPVSISWTGVAAGEVHLGVVSHNDGSGPIGFTLVEVTG